jgi:hypothetical protein
MLIGSGSLRCGVRSHGVTDIVGDGWLAHLSMLHHVGLQVSVDLRPIHAFGVVVSQPYLPLVVG